MRIFFVVDVLLALTVLVYVLVVLTVIRLWLEIWHPHIWKWIAEYFNPLLKEAK